MDFVSRVCLLCLVLLASVAEVNALTSLNLPDFTSASQTAVGGLFFNGEAADTADGTLNTNANATAAGNFFFNQQIDATFPSFSAFYLVSYDTSACAKEECNDGVALILQTVGLNFYSPSTTWGIPQETGSFAVGFENSNRYEYEVDDGNENGGGPAYYVYSPHYYYSSYSSETDVYTWVDYNHRTLQLDVYFSFYDTKGSAVHAISKSGVDIFANLNPLFGTYYVGLGASTGMYPSYSGYPTNEGHQAISMWFNACLDCNAPCGAPTNYTVTTCPPPIEDLAPIISFSTPFDESFPAYTLNGNAQLNNYSIELTATYYSGESGSIYLTSPVDISKPFSVFYQVQIQCFTELGSTECADGFAFVLQPTSPALLGKTGGSVAIEGASGPYWAITALTYTTMTLNLVTFPFSQANYNSLRLGLLDFFGPTSIYVNVWLDYDPTGHVDASYPSALGVIRYSAQSSSTVPSKPSAATGVISSTTFNIQQVLNSTLAFIGISAATGESTESHTVELWTFQGSYCTPDLHPGCSSFALNSCYCQVCSTNYVSNGNGGCYVTSFSTPVTSSSFPLYSLNGDAVLSGNLVQLTSSDTNKQASSVYVQSDISVINSFSMFVQVAITCNASLTTTSCADGFAINFQPKNPFVVGGYGIDIGILGQSTPFYSVGLETSGKNTLSLYVHPADGFITTLQQANLGLATNTNTATINVWIDYNPSLSLPFVVFYSNQAVSSPTKPTNPIFRGISTLYSVLNSVSAYVGLSAGTSSYHQQQVINSWIFCGNGQTLNSTAFSCISPTPTPTATATPTSTPTPTSTTVVTTDAPTTPGSTVSPTPVSSSSSSLSTGAIAAIATIFSILGVVLIALLIFFLVRRQNGRSYTKEINDKIGMVEKN